MVPFHCVQNCCFSLLQVPLLQILWPHLFTQDPLCLQASVPRTAVHEHRAKNITHKIHRLTQELYIEQFIIQQRAAGTYEILNLADKVSGLCVTSSAPQGPPRCFEGRLTRCSALLIFSTLTAPNLPHETVMKFHNSYTVRLPPPRF